MALQAPEFIEADYWARNRSRYLGLLVAAAVLVFGVLFFQNYREAKAAEAWAALVDEDGRAKAHIDVDGPVGGTPAEPWALFQNAHSAFVEKDLDDAEGYAARIGSDFPDHVLNRDGRVEKLLADIRAEKAWVAEHPIAEKNPDVDDAHSVTIQTSLGAVKIGLYPEHAPDAVAAFLDLVDQGGLASGSFHEAMREQWIAFSAESGSDDEAGDGADDEAESEEEEVEPSKLAQGIVGDRNGLSHFAGAVSFLRGAPGSLKPDARPRIAVYLVDMPSKGGQEVVFGQVQSGLEILSQASTRDVEEGTALAE
ncbi:MAG: peptidylprolyl isomerase, partial [Planctomycetota bacterium JB042]